MHLVTAKLCLVLVLLRILHHAAISWDSHSIAPPATSYLEPTACLSEISSVTEDAARPWEGFAVLEGQ